MLRDVTGAFAPRDTVIFCVLAWIISSLLAAYVGPMGTYSSMTFPVRLAYWSSLIGVSIVLGFSIRFLVLRAFGGDGLKTDLIGAGVMSVVFGTLVFSYNSLIGHVPFGDGAYWLKHVLVVLIVCLGVICLRGYGRYAKRAAARAAKAALARDETAEVAEAEAVTTEEPPLAPFLRRLDPALGVDLKSVSANDHYLEVVTEAGSQRLLLRFRDALEELAEIPGLRVHRSHWVAKSAIVSTRQSGRRTFVVLCNGREYPVSAAYMAEFRALGFSASDERNATDGADAA